MLPFVIIQSVEKIRLFYLTIIPELLLVINGHVVITQTSKQRDVKRHL